MFDLSRGLSIAVKEVRHIRRDPRTLLLVALSPAVMLLAFGYLFSFEVKQVRIAVVDLDRSETSRRYIALLSSGDELRLVAMPASQDEVAELMLRGEVDAALVVPSSLETDLVRGKRVPIQAIVDGSDPLSARQNAAALTARTAAFNANLLISQQIAATSPVDVRSRVLYNPELKSVMSMVPGLLAVVLIVPALAIVISIAREKETGTFESLASTPVNAAEYLLGKLAAHTGFALISALGPFLVAVLWFQVPFRGDLLLLLLLVLDYVVAVMGIAMLVATMVSSQQAAMLIVLLLFFVPSFFVTGLLVPVRPDSAAAQVMAFVLPPTHFVIIGRSLFMKGAGLAELVQPAATLAAMGAASVAASIAVFRKEAA